MGDNRGMNEQRGSRGNLANLYSDEMPGSSLAFSQIYKSGHLAVSSKGLGWKSWKRRWFLLTRTSLVFFKTEPKGNIDGSLVLGEIALNNAGTVHVRMDKKQLSLRFPDGRAFTLKAEIAEELDEWKDALKQALAAAPSPELIIGGEGFFQKDGSDILSEFPSLDFSAYGGSRRAARSLVVGRPILLALEDIDGSPSFLEKAIQFIENHGAKVEGILRESADVAEVEKRVLEYEQGRTEFSDDENAHVIGDCIKHVLRELPSSPMPASCCAALLESLNVTKPNATVEAMRSAIHESFPEPNRRLLHRLMKMMRVVVAHEDENRMNVSAVSACMAPLLLRPLLAGECSPSSDDETDDGAQIRAATKSAGQAQKILVLLIENLDQLFPAEDPEVVAFRPQFSLWPREDSDEDEDDEGEEGEEEEGEGKDVMGSKYFLRSGISWRRSGGSDGSNSEVTSVSDSSSGPLPRSPKIGIKNTFTFQPVSGTLGKESGERAREREGERDREEGEGEGGAPKVRPLVRMASGSLAVLAASGRQSSGKWDPVNDSLGASINSLSEDDGPLGDKVKGESHDGLLRTQSSLYNVNHKGRSPGRNSNVRSNGRPGVDLRGQSKIPLGDEEAQLQVLELTRQDLKASLSKEVRANALLKDSMGARKALLAEKRMALERDVLGLREQLQAQRAAQAVETGTPLLDRQTEAELEEIGSMEKDVQRLKTELGSLQRQLAHARQQQNSPASLAAGNDRQRKIEALLSLKSRLKAELQRTLALCQEEQRKNWELEEKRKREDPGALEKSVALQRAALAEAQAALQAEMYRGKELRRRMHAAQRDRGGGGGGGPPEDLDGGGEGLRISNGSVNGIHGSLSNEEGKTGNREEFPPGIGGGIAGGGLGGGGGVSVLGKVRTAGGATLSTATSLAELSSRLEHFKERRFQLMRQLSQLSAEPPSPRLGNARERES